MSAVTFNLDNLTGADAVPLFCQYPREYRPQPAHVEMDQHGEVSAGYNPDPSRYSTSSKVADGLSLRWSVEPCAKPGRLADLLREHAELFQRVHDGHEAGNYSGRLSDEARAASDDLGRILRDFGADPDNLVAVWTADPGRSDKPRGLARGRAFKPERLAAVRCTDAGFRLALHHKTRRSRTGTTKRPGASATDGSPRIPCATGAMKPPSGCSPARSTRPSAGS